MKPKLLISNILNVISNLLIIMIMVALSLSFIIAGLYLFFIIIKIS